MVPMCWGGVAGYMVPMCCGGVAGYGTHVLWWSSWLWYPCVVVESIAGLYGVHAGLGSALFEGRG